MRKTLTAAAVAASLISGAAALLGAPAATAQSPSVTPVRCARAADGATRADVIVHTLTPGRSANSAGRARLAGPLAVLVADGTISPDQADKVATALADLRPARARPGRLAMGGICGPPPALAGDVPTGNVPAGNMPVLAPDTLTYNTFTSTEGPAGPVVDGF